MRNRRRVHRNTSRTALLALVLLACAACAANSPQLPLPVPAEDVGLQPGDVIQVRIWREPDLGGDFRVDSRGLVVLPRLGDVNVEGWTAEELSDSIKAAYEKYLKNPSIEVTALRRVSVLGEVRSPGLYPVDATISVSDVLALAGGLTPNADPNKIRLVQNGQIVDVKLEPETVVERSAIRSGDQILVGEKSWLARNSGVIAAALITSATIIIVNVAVN